jgi:hypothetical protein
MKRKKIVIPILIALTLSSAVQANDHRKKDPISKSACTPFNNERWGLSFCAPKGWKIESSQESGLDDEKPGMTDNFSIHFKDGKNKMQSIAFHNQDELTQELFSGKMTPIESLRTKLGEPYSKCTIETTGPWPEIFPKENFPALIRCPKEEAGIAAYELSLVVGDRHEIIWESVAEGFNPLEKDFFNTPAGKARRDFFKSIKFAPPKLTLEKNSKN